MKTLPILAAAFSLSALSACGSDVDEEQSEAAMGEETGMSQQDELAADEPGGPIPLDGEAEPAAGEDAGESAGEAMDEPSVSQTSSAQDAVDDAVADAEAAM
jgi:hypothetical protein